MSAAEFHLVGILNKFQLTKTKKLILFFNNAPAVVLRWKWLTTFLTLANNLVTASTFSAFWAAKLRQWAKQPICGLLFKCCAATTILAALSVTNGELLDKPHSAVASLIIPAILTPVWLSGIARVCSTKVFSFQSGVIWADVTVTYDSVARLVHPSVVKATTLALDKHAFTLILILNTFEG